MASLNKVLIIGRLGADPEVRALNSGSKVVNLRVACSEQWRDKATGEKRERTEWTRVVIFNERLAGVAEQYLRKGSQCYLEGQLQTRKYTDQSGVEKFSTEVVLQNFRGDLVLLDGKPGGDRDERPTYDIGSDRDPQASGRSISERATPGGPARPLRDTLNDDVPFSPQVL